MRFAVLLFALLATGCAALRPGAEEALTVREIVEVAIDALRSPPQVQREQLSMALDVLASHPGDTSRLRAAVLLATLPEPLRDDARASALLRPLAERGTDTPLAQFAGLLQARLAASEGAQQRLRSAEREAEALREQLEAMRTSERGAAEREEALRRRTQALRAAERGVAEREETLRRQLEALREGERVMTEREDTVRRQVEAMRENERRIIEREERLGTRTR